MKYVQFVLLFKLQTLWNEAIYTKMANARTTLTQGGPCNHCCSGKAVSITYSECVCSLSHPACNAHVPYCHLWPVWLYNIFPHYLTNGTNFENIGLHIKYLSLLSHFKETWISSKRLSKNTQIQNFMKICPVETELFHVDG
jgi:hypothetical protein